LEKSEAIITDNIYAFMTWETANYSIKGEETFNRVTNL